MPTWRDDVVAALTRGEKIEAIRLYREATGVGLAEAKSFVEQLAETLTTGELPPTPATSDDADLLSLLQKGEKIGAIKIYRDRYGVDLKGAKDAVEAIAERAGLPKTGSGCLVLLGAMSCGLTMAIAGLLADA